MNAYQPKEYKLVALRECPTPDQMQLCDNPDVAADYWRNLPVHMRESTFDEIVSKCEFVPPGLPKNKPLRTVQIGDRQIIPCGGIHVKELQEIGRVLVGTIKRDAKSNNLVIPYRITNGAETHMSAVLETDSVQNAN